MIALPSTVSAVEVAWTAMALPGLLLSIYNTVGAYRDVRLPLGRRPAPGRLGRPHQGLARIGDVLLVLLTGLVAMQVPEPVRPSVQDAADFIATCLLVMDALTLALAVAFFWERRYVVPHVHMLRDRG
jgi:hypothetical protein